jgi:hypothetical protein
VQNRGHDGGMAAIAPKSSIGVLSPRVFPTRLNPTTPKSNTLGDALDVDVLPPEATDALGDTRLAERVARDEPDFLGLSLYL